MVENKLVNNYVSDVVDKIDDNAEEVNKLDKDVVNMEKEWFGEDYKNNMSYLDEQLKLKAQLQADK